MLKIINILHHILLSKNVALIRKLLINEIIVTTAKTKLMTVAISKQAMINSIHNVLMMMMMNNKKI